MLACAVMFVLVWACPAVICHDILSQKIGCFSDGATGFEGREHLSRNYLRGHCSMLKTAFPTVFANSWYPIVYESTLLFWKKVYTFHQKSIMFLTKKYILFCQRVYTFCQKSIYVLRERYNRSEKKVYLFWGEGVIVLQNCKLFFVPFIAYYLTFLCARDRWRQAR